MSAHGERGKGVRTEEQQSKSMGAGGAGMLGLEVILRGSVAGPWWAGRKLDGEVMASQSLSPGIVL